MVIQVIYLALLMRVMAKEGPVLRKPINWMILVDEAIRFLGSVGGLHATYVLGMWPNSGEEGTTGCDPSCCVFVFFNILGSFWNIIGGAGFKYLNSTIQES